MAKRPLKGLSIKGALRRWGDPALLARLDQLKADVDQATAEARAHPEAAYRDIVEALGHGLKQRLESGELRARGLVRGAPVTVGKVDVDPERWAELEIDYDLDEIAGPNGFVMTAVEIRKAEPDEAEEQGGLATTAANRGFEHDPNYCWVRLRGEKFNLGPQQARVVRHLHAASQTDDPWVHGKELLRQKPSISSSSIRDLFKSKPNWRVLIDSDGRGIYRLNLP
jgi:hypothetical protein